MGPLNEQHLLNVIMVSRDADRRRYNLVIPENSKLLCIILVGVLASQRALAYFPLVVNFTTE